MGNERPHSVKKSSLLFTVFCLLTGMPPHSFIPAKSALWDTVTERLKIAQSVCVAPYRVMNQIGTHWLLLSSWKEINDLTNAAILSCLDIVYGSDFKPCRAFSDSKQSTAGSHRCTTGYRYETSELPKLSLEYCFILLTWEMKT